MTMTGKNRSRFWWVMAVCAAAVIIIFLLRGGRATGPRSEGKRVSLPKWMNVYGTIPPADTAGAASSGTPRGVPAESMPAAVEHGTASLADPSPPSSSTEYVDGPIVFQDDFEEGAKRWNVSVLRGPVGEHRLDESAAIPPECVRVEARKIHGARSNALVLEHKGIGERATIAVVPSTSIGVTAFSFEADTCVKEDSGMSCLISAAGPQEVVYRNAEFTHSPDHWKRIRMSLVSRTDGMGRPYFEMKFYIKGTLISHIRNYTSQAIPGFVLDRGKALIDNVVIREMVPKEE